MSLPGILKREIEGKRELELIFKEVEKSPHGKRGLKLLKETLERYFDPPDCEGCPKGNTRLGRDERETIGLRMDAEFPECPLCFLKGIALDYILEVFSIRFPRFEPIYRRKREMLVNMRPRVRNAHSELEAKRRGLAHVIPEGGWWIEVEVGFELSRGVAGAEGGGYVELIRDPKVLEERIMKWDFTMWRGDPTCMYELSYQSKEEGLSLKEAMKKADEEAKRGFE